MLRVHVFAYGQLFFAPFGTVPQVPVPGRFFVCKCLKAQIKKTGMTNITKSMLSVHPISQSNVVIKKGIDLYLASETIFGTVSKQGVELSPLIKNIHDVYMNKR
jgi:hypothetical protein